MYHDTVKMSLTLLQSKKNYIFDPLCLHFIRPDCRGGGGLKILLDIYLDKTKTIKLFNKIRIHYTRLVKKEL